MFKSRPNREVAAASDIAVFLDVVFSSLAYLNNIYAGVQVDGSFGFLAVFLILVGVEDVGTVRELRQVEVPPFEHLQFTTMESKSGSFKSNRIKRTCGL